ncbi:MAG TPA: glycosyltransferase family 1 protein [Terriglobales bacterium]|nr:glycosyltransferase family 1 protein [Terriglobales bacterium]
MKIAFDLRRIGNPGIGRYMKCLVQAIFKQETDHEYLLLLPEHASDVISSDCCKATRITARSPYYSIREQIELPLILREHKVDLLHSPHFVLPLFRPCPAVITIHDVIYLACPQDLPSKLGRTYYAAMMHAAARSANRIITDSNFSKREIVHYLRINPEKIDVIYCGVDPGFSRISDRGILPTVLTKFGIERDYILYTGIYKARKNHAGLLRAFKEIVDTGVDTQLVIAGPMNEGEPHLRSLVHELQLDNRVTFTGRVEDLELRALYSAARVYACPSLYEGFGFTILEAMACGVPVVCSRAASLPEIGGDAALYANARNPEEFGSALYQAFTDEPLRRRLVESGLKNVSRFRWKQAAGYHLNVYHKVMGVVVEQISFSQTSRA